MHPRACLLLAIFLGTGGVSSVSAGDPSLDVVHQFFRKHCVDCHAGDADEGGFRINALLDASRRQDDDHRQASYERIFRQLSRGTMPPQEVDQPTKQERHAAIEALKTWLGQRIDDRESRNAGAFARRLNREELQNDLFDTLGIDRTLYGLPPFVEGLPEEGRTDGFDTVGHGLGQSSLLISQYQQFVDHYLTLAAKENLRPQRWRFPFGTRYLEEDQTVYDNLGPRGFAYEHRRKEGEPDRSVPAFDLTWKLENRTHSPHESPNDVEAAFRTFFPSAAKNNDRGHLNLNRRGGLPFFQEDDLLISDSLGMRMRKWPLSVAETGRYRVRIRCRLRFTEGVEPQPVRVRYFNRSHHFAGRFEQRDLVDDAMFSFDEDCPRLCFENPDRSVEISPGEWIVLEFEDFRSTNETYDATRSGFTFDFRFACDTPPKTRRAPREQPAKKGQPAIVPTLDEIEAHYPFLVEVDYLEVEGPYPLVDREDRVIPSPPASESDARTTANACLEKLLPRLYRGAVEPSDLELHLEIFDRNFARTGDFGSSLRATLCAAYLSPKHLFVSNAAVDRKPGTPLSSHDLATRLSLFLWSSTPDAELRAAADRGELTDPAVLKEQTNRLLDHPYASELTANFASQWLHLYNIGLNEPDPDLYKYDKRLQQAMVNESLRFFHEIFRTEGSIRQFLDSDWVLVNDKLADLYRYKLTGEEDHQPFSSWRKVPVSALPDYAGVRGGLLGQASILKLTSGSIRTSIVSRGMFILENLLDDPPPPPPENVGEIANAVADLDQLTVRQQLEFHRQRKSCAVCHEKIDPLGFALENYGVLGQWRTTETDGMKPIIEVVETVVPFKGGTRLQRKEIKTERQGQPVDTQAVVMGTPVDGPRELRDLLLTKDDLFALCLASKLMVYGLGRSLRHQDEAVIDRIVDRAAEKDYRLRDIIELIVLSESFRTY